LKRPGSLFALLLLAAALPAQQPLHFSPVFRNYTTDQGLPNNWIFGIQQDRRGYLWVSTQKGVCRFDGYTLYR
jgi:ligand-binding sensor domain-containing protein